MRRTMLYLPGNNPNMLTRGWLFGSDGVILDLEDAVAMSEKDTARILVSRYLEQGEFGNCEVTVRINGVDTEYWREDLAAIVPMKRLDGVRAPKVDGPETVKILDEELSILEDKNGIPQGKLKLFCLLETAKGIWNAYDIATASPRVAAIIPGGEDLRADLRTERSDSGTELEWARRMLVFAARAAGVDPLDTVYARVTDDEGLRREAEFSDSPRRVQPDRSRNSQGPEDNRGGEGSRGARTGSRLRRRQNGRRPRSQESGVHAHPRGARIGGLQQ